MRAVAFSEYGGPEVMGVVELPDPTAGEGEVLVAVEAASINPVDKVVHTGAASGRMPEGSAPPYVVGWDLAGHIVAVGEGVDASLVGKYVLGFIQWFGSGKGAQASLVSLTADQYAVASETIPPAELTTLGLNGLTALGVVTVAAPGPGDTVLVTGATGGVGGFVVQFASQRGATVWAMADDEDAELVTAFGASRVVPRDAEANAGAGADLVIDTASLGAAILPAIHDGGKYFTVTQPPESVRDIPTRRVGVREDRAGLAEIVTLAASGDLALRVEKTFPAEDAVEAYRHFESGKHRGRVVLTF